VSMPFVAVTGANGNIGSHLAERFLQTGWHVALLYHRAHERVDHLLRAYGAPAEAHAVDLMDSVALEALFAHLPVTALVHTAGVRAADARSLVASDPTVWNRVLTENLVSAANLLRAAIPALRAAAPGRVVLFGSDVSREGLKNGSAYAAAKAGVANLARSLSREEPDLLVNVVSPGPVVIDDSHFSEEYRIFRERYYAEQLLRTPTGRLADLEDLWGVCRFLVSSENRHINGEEIVVNGGKL